MSIIKKTGLLDNEIKIRANLGYQFKKKKLTSLQETVFFISILIQSSLMIFLKNIKKNFKNLTNIQFNQNQNHIQFIS